MVYVDSNNRCHVSKPESAYKEVTHPFFEERSEAFIEGYCYDDSKGYVQISPWKPYDELDAAQREYERELLADAENALAILLGGGA